MSLVNLLSGLQQTNTLPGDTLPVQGRGLLVEGDKDDTYAYENIPDIQKRDFGLEAGEETADRKGMFGVKGTLRDILGTVGDAFLIQSGNNPIYAPAREREKMSDAMAGFTTGDEEALAAIERVAGVNPEAAQAMMEQYQRTQYQESQAASGAMRASTGERKEERQAFEQARDYVSQAYAAAVASGDEGAMQKAFELAQAVSQETGRSLEELGVGEGMTEQEARVLAGRSATVNQNLRLPQQERSLDIRQQNANTSSGRASEQSRANRSRETIQRERIRQSDVNSQRTDSRLRENAGGTSSTSVRTLRGSTSNPTSSPRLNIRPVGQ